LKHIQTTSDDALYRRILGDAWAGLDQSVRELHPGAEAWRGVGRFTVRHGTGRLARMLARLLKLPPAGEDIPVRLTITRTEGRESWQREFAGQRFVTGQREDKTGLLVEDFGLTDVWYRLEVSDGALVYQQVKSALRVGSWHIRIPGPLFPRIAARESPLAGQRGTHVRVLVTLSLIGLLVSYEGHIEKEETMP
jgi:hypothetical protein